MHDDTIAIYIHWPFCKSKCPYCDFNSHVQEQINNETWLNAYLKQIDRYTEFLADKTISSIFFGGGTPSLMPANTAEKIISKLMNFRTASEIEITLEANPTSIENQKFKDFKAAGINRVSIGIQSFDESDLKFLGREHSKVEAIEALEIASKIFANYSFDLIYARPNQTLESWERELLQALPYMKNHLSLYQLTIEKGTPFYLQHKNKKFILPDQDLAADLYIFTNKFMASHGLPSYEISNYARPGFESRHNLTYWRYHQYLGIGPGAHSRISINDRLHSVVMQHAPQKWLDLVMNDEQPIQQQTSLSDKDMLFEYLVMGLRINEGIDLRKFQQLLTQPLVPLLNWKNIDKLQSIGYITCNCDNIAITEEGKLVLNTIVEQMIG